MLKLIAAGLASYVCLAAALVAHASEGRTTIAIAPALSSTDSFCADLQNQISAQRTRFSGWRCKQGPNVRGRQTILAWVTLTALGDKAHLSLMWLAETRPVVDALVIDVVNVPRYGYQPRNVRLAFQVADVA